MSSGEVCGAASVEVLPSVDSPPDAGWVGTLSTSPPATAVWVAILPSSASSVLIALSGVSDAGGGVDAESLHPDRINAEVTNTMKIM